MTDRTRSGPKFPLRLDALKGRDAAPRQVAVKSNAKVAAAPVAPSGAHGATPSPTAAGVAARTLLRPQRLVGDAVADAARRRHSAPAGIGLDSADVRHRMMQRLRTQGITHEQVLAAMAAVPRHVFVDAALVTQAYEDTSLPIGHGQTISKPSVVARMIELLLHGAYGRAGQGLGRVLEIGTGCGYQAAVLAQLARHVVSVERLQPLHERARTTLQSIRPPHLRLVYGDGMLGHPPNAPYDSIIAAAGGQAVPQAWLDQLAVGGRLVAPMRSAQGHSQVLVIIDRTETGFEQQTSETVHFVPLKSGLGT